MKSVFVESTIFEKYRDEYLSDEEYRLFQAELMLNPPKLGDVIKSTGGLRKIRVASDIFAPDANYTARVRWELYKTQQAEQDDLAEIQGVTHWWQMA